MAKIKFNWQVDSTKLLISEYEKNEVLYNPKHSDYKNRNQRQVVYKDISEAINNVFNTSIPACSVEDVKKKINGLRSQYLSEKMKILNSKKSGADGGDIYTPTVYWFSMLKFLEASTEGDCSESNLDAEEQPNLEYVNNPIHEDTSTSAPEMDHTQSSKSKRKKTVVDPDTLIMQASKAMAEMSQLAKTKSSHHDNDSFDTFGKFVSSELRSMNKQFNNAHLERQVKWKIQNILMETWNKLECESTSFNNDHDYFVMET